MEHFQPRVILALGGVALRESSGEVGKSRTISHLRGYVLPSLGVDLNEALVFPTYHPAFIRRGAAHLTGVFMRDIQRAVMIAQGRDRNFAIGEYERWQVGQSTLRYQTRPSIDEAYSFYQYLSSNPALPFAYDLETVETLSLDEDAREQFADTVIRTIQFSYEPGSGICLPWANGYRDLAARIMQLPNPKVGHNAWLFDLKVLAAVRDREGYNLVPRDLGHDTLQMFHHWQPDLPAHLQYAASFVQFPFPWKHLSESALEFYGIADVDATLRLYYEAQRTMRARGIWDGYVSSVYEVRPVLARIEDRGLPIDDAERLKLDQEFEKAQGELQHELDSRFPDEARSIHPKEGYKKTPKDTSGLVLRSFSVADVDDNGNPCVSRVDRWCRLEPFSPNSAPQLLRYMKARKHPTPKDKKKAEANGDAGETTAKKELQRLAAKTGDDFYLKVIECREFGKMRGTYIEGFKPLSDGRVHATITFDTATWQLAAKNPNIMNFPKHGRLAKIVRKMVAAPPGRKIVEFDFKAFHVLTTGYFAESANYMRLARLDMHSFVAGHFAKCWDAEKLFGEPDEELRAKFKWFKSDPERKVIRDKKAKPSILGIGFGLGVRKLYDMNRESFSSESEARRVREIIEHLFPEVFRWQDRIRQQAHDQTYLRSPFGGIRWFYDVYQWSSKMHKWAGGDQSEQAIAYLPATAAFGHIRDRLKEIDQLGYAERYGLVNNIHDAASFIVRDEDVDECLRQCYDVLVAPSKVLVNKVAPGGLWCDVDGSVGSNWSEMTEVAIPKLVVQGAGV